MASDDAILFEVDSSNLDHVVQRVIEPGRFFIARDFALRVEAVRKRHEVWEIFNGQLLGNGQTREQSVFDTWQLYLDQAHRLAEQPLIEIKWSPAARRLYITRSLLVRGWETYEPRPKVIESREANVWARELVGWMDGSQATDEASFIAELATYVRAALAGTSRLAITSLENPLPDFALGHIAYVATDVAMSKTPTVDPCLLVASIPTAVQDSAVAAGMVETALRTADSAMLPEVTQALATRLAAKSDAPATLTRVVRTLFNRVSLSPYTRLTDNLVDLLSRVAHVEALGVPASIDTISYMLRHLVRHLTAFNLTTFHNQGANYPDALFLDRLLTAYVQLISQHADLFRGRHARLRRRALRQAYLVRTSLEGVCFPDAPTSPGEQQRVLPAELPTVPEQQILDPSARTRVLFEAGSSDALLGDQAAPALAESLVDLQDDRELRELGRAVFLDRPLGFFHPPGHPDRTPLVSYEAYSQEIATTRLLALCAAQPSIDADSLRAHLPQAHDTAGIRLDQVGGAPRPGVVSLADAALVAEDFVFTRTTRSSLDALLQVMSVEQDASLAWLSKSPHVLFIRTKECLLAGFDRDMQQRCAVKAIPPIEYELRWNVERLRNGVRMNATA